MRISDTGGAGLAGRPARHEAHEVQDGLLRVLLLVLVVSQALLEEFVDDEVDDGLADPPPGGCQTFPEAEYAALSVYPPDDHRQVAV